MAGMAGKKKAPVAPVAPHLLPYDGQPHISEHLISFSSNKITDYIYSVRLPEGYSVAGVCDPYHIYFVGPRQVKFYLYTAFYWARDLTAMQHAELIMNLMQHAPWAYEARGSENALNGNYITQRPPGWTPKEAA